MSSRIRRWRRWADAGAAIRGGGVVALFWNEEDYPDPRVGDAFTDAYDRRRIEIRSVRGRSAASPDGDRPDGWPETEADAQGYFTHLRMRRYHWTRRMPVADYVATLNTTSAHLILAPEVRDDLTAELVTTLTGYGNEIELAMTTDLATAVRR